MSLMGLGVSFKAGSAGNTRWIVALVANMLLLLFSLQAYVVVVVLVANICCCCCFFCCNLVGVCSSVIQ